MDDSSDDKSVNGETKSPKTLMDILDFEGKNEIERMSDIAKIIENRSVRARFLFSFMIGLPNSGITTLLLKLLNRERELGGSNRLDIYETMLFKDSVTGDSQLRDITDVDDKNDAMLLFSLAKFLVTKHYKISEEILQKELCNAAVFHSKEVNSYFCEVCEKLFAMMKAIEESHDLQVRVTRSHSFVNFFDMNLSKAAYELAVLLGCTYKYSVILFNVLNLSHYTNERLLEPLNLEDEFYGGKYDGEELHLFDLHRALDYFMNNIEETFTCQRNRPNTLLVGTDAGHIPDGKICEQMRSIQRYAEEIGVEKALSPAGMLYIKSDEDYEKVKREFFKIVDNDKEFEVHVPMKFMFLRCVLHSTKKLFVTRAELENYAESCFVKTEKEVDNFLHLFQKCCSLLVFPANSAYVILQPANFVKGLEKLYKDRKSLDPEDLGRLKNGFLIEKLARGFWNGHYEFYTSVLLQFGLMVKIKGEDAFFMPSLRSEHDKEVPSPLSNSLIILYSVSRLPFHNQCEFVTTFLDINSSNGSYKFTLKNCQKYNVVKFDCQAKTHEGEVKVEVAIRFRSDYLELYITSEYSKVVNIQISSFLKATCFRLLNNMEFRGLRYNLAIVCPHSKETNPHFIKFVPREFSSLEQTCSLKECEFNRGGDCLDNHPALHWVDGSQDVLPIHPPADASLSAFPNHLKEVADTLSKEAKLQHHQNMIQKFEEKLGVKSNRDSSEQLDDIVLSLFSEWHRINPTATVAELAQHLRDLGFSNVASKLDPMLEGTCTEEKNSIDNPED